MSVLLKNLPLEERPRERLKKFGATKLSDEDLITILLRTGTKDKSAKDLACEILANCKNIHDLKNLSINKLNKIKGLGDAKSITILAALELGKRVYEKEDVKERIRISCPADVYVFFSKYIVDKNQENMMVIYLDNQKRYITHKILFKGTINSSLIHPREIFKSAIEEDASFIIVMHNHPSGDLMPSKSDDDATASIANTGSLMCIPMLDHIIASKNGYYSYLEDGRLKYE